MSIWQPHNGSVDWQLAQSGPVNYFPTATALDEAVESLQPLGYRIIAADLTAWSAESDLHNEFSRRFDFPAYYGRNLNALHDCLSDVAELRYGWTANDTGVVIALAGFESFAAKVPHVGASLLDSLSATVFRGALIGNRVLALVHAERPAVTVFN